MTDKNTAQLTFEKYLTTVFEKRCQKNPHYSMRAFARDLGIPSANLSRAMSGARGFSAETLKQVSNRLALNADESMLLKSLCEKQFSKSKKIKEAATIKLKQAFLYQVKVADEKVSLISDWYHMAILALMDSNTFKSDIKWIAEQLNIHEKIAESAIERLISVGAIKKDNDKLISTGNLFIDPQGVPSSAVKDFHHQIIKKADEAIDMQGLDDRDIASLVMCFDKSKMKEAKEEIRKFREHFEAKFGPNENANHQEVYAMGIQFYQVTKFKENKNIKGSLK